MPLYEFTCPKGHVTEALCKSDLSDAPKTCETLMPHCELCKGNAGWHVCGGKLERKLSAPASTFPGADKWRGGI